MPAITAHRSKATADASAQLGLFDGLIPAGAPEVKAAIEPIRIGAPVAPGVIRLNIQAPKPQQRRPVPKAPTPRLLTIADMPEYPPTEIAAIERTIAAIPTDRALLGYRDIQTYFGVSKATANRRMKQGLVPGVRMINGVVIRDGGVRRLSREQVRWLLLAVRFSKVM